MQRVKTFFIGLYYFLSSRYFLKHFAGMSASFLVLMSLLFWFLRSYTLHGESTEVPDLTYQKISQIEDFIKVRNLQYIIADSVYHSDKEPGIILEQYPKARSRVKESRKIYLVVNRWTPPSVNLYYKDLIGRPLNHVQRKFANLDLRIGKQEFIAGPAKNTICRVSVNGQVLLREADPAKGEAPPAAPIPVPKGTVVDLQLYEGEDAAPRMVPPVQCLLYGEAELVIKNNQFNLGKVHLAPGLVDTLKGVVWRQVPEVQTQASAGSGIDIWLRPEPCE